MMGSGEYNSSSHWILDERTENKKKSMFQRDTCTVAQENSFMDNLWLEKGYFLLRRLT